MADIQARRALYYPYIYPRDVEWLKGTLLAFGQVNRIVPEGFPLHDKPEVKWLSEQPGPYGEPFVCAISPDWPDIEYAQQRLFSLLQRVDEDELRRRFGRETTRVRFGADDRFEIHENKLNAQLHEWLQRGDLIWLTRDWRNGKWWGLHPQLGEVVMSVMAIAAAKRKGLDIVTDSVPLHAALTSLNEQQLVAELLESAAPPLPTPPQPAHNIDRLGHLVMTAHLDVRELSVADVAELVRDGADLQRFRRAIAELALEVPLDVAPDVADRMLRERAEEIVEEWSRHRQSLPKKLRAALRETTADKSGKLLEEASEALALAAATGGSTTVAALFTGEALTTTVLKAGVGFAVGLLVAGGRKLFTRSQEEPLQYLSRIEHAGGMVLAVPRGDRAGGRPS
jgi:hypothetical protein